MKPFVALGSPADTFTGLHAGYRPLGAVVGVSVVAPGNPNAQSGLNGAELRVHTDAVTLGLENARRRAVEQAITLGATGVVGVRLELREMGAVLQGLVEVRCVGTAVRGDAPNKTPFLSNLSGTDLLALHAAGYRPVGMAVGFCFYTQSAGYRTTNARAAASSPGRLFPGPYEVPDHTEAVYKARAIAMDRMNADALASGSEGVVGVEFTSRTRGGAESVRIEFVIVGTGVRRERGVHEPPVKPAIVKSLKP